MGGGETNGFMTLHSMIKNFENIKAWLDACTSRQKVKEMDAVKCVM